MTAGIKKPMKNHVIILILLIFTGIAAIISSITSLQIYSSNVTISTNSSAARDDIQTDVVSAAITKQPNFTANGMPKYVFMYWDKGLEHLKFLSKNDPPNKYAADYSCVKMMIDINPSWNVVVLNENSAKQYAPIFASVVSNETLSPKLGPSHKADLLRLELLSIYGGVWADTSICPFIGMDHFITDWVGTEENGFFAKPSNQGKRKGSALSTAAGGNVPFCHDHSKISNTGRRGKGSPFRTSSTWFIATTNLHNPIVDEWLAIYHKHLLTLNTSLPYFLAHCALTQARLYNETVDSIWSSTMTRYGSGSEKVPCLGVRIQHGLSSGCAIVKRPPKMFVLSGNYSKSVEMELSSLLGHDKEVDIPSHVQPIGGEDKEEDNDERKSRRMKAINATAGIFSYVHISKCSGSTWVTLLKRLNLRVFPQFRAGRQEFSVHYQRNKLGTKAAYHSTSLRSPRHHVFSMFMHCKYFKKKGQVQWWDDTDENDFRSWLDHHLPMGQENRDLYQCYFHPANYQSRHLTSIATRPHGLEDGDPFEPNRTAAMETYWELDFVSLSEFVHESRCLLYYRMKSNTTSEALRYLDNNCRCDADSSKNGSDETKDNIHVSHHKGTHRSKLIDLPQDILDKVQELTKIDVGIYSIALPQFMAEIAWLESEDALGRRVLCDGVLEPLEPELSYLPTVDGQKTNVTQLYLQAIEMQRNKVK